MVSEATFYGGATQISSATSIEITPGEFRVYRVNMTAGSQSVKLPDATSPVLGTGGPVYYILNAGANTFTVVDQSDVTQTTLATNEYAILLLRAIPDADGRWLTRKGSW